MITKPKLENMIIEALNNSSGAASIVDVGKFIWGKYENDLRNSDDLFYVPLRGTCFNIPTPCAFRANKIIIEEKTFLRKYITISNAN